MLRPYENPPAVHERPVMPTPEEVHAVAVKTGWYDDDDLDNLPVTWLPAKLALIHSEISEALAEYRLNGLNTLPAKNLIAVELADVILRIYDVCAALGMPIEEIVVKKHAYNKTRPTRHGGKVI